MEGDERGRRSSLCLLATYLYYEESKARLTISNFIHVSLGLFCIICIVYFNGGAREVIRVPEILPLKM